MIEMETNISEIKSKPSKQLQRLATYQSYVPNGRSLILKSVLANAGFFFTGTNGIIKCESCQMEIDTWLMDADPLRLHIENSPTCPLAINFKSRFLEQPKANQQLISRSMSIKELESSINDSDIEMDDIINSDEQNIFFKQHSIEKITHLRARTFSNWPLIKPSLREMVQAGWWFTNISDRVICLYCHVSFHNWTENVEPFQLHRTISPMCPFVRIAEKPFMKIPPIAKILSSDDILSSPGPVHKYYSVPTDRLKTFESLSSEDIARFPPLESLVNAGFFFTGTKLILKCFYCDGALQNWRPDDDPKVEHARWHPRCQYIITLLGDETYGNIQRANAYQKNEKLKSSMNENSNETWSQNDIDRMTRARIDLPICETLKKQGYRISILKKAIEMQLKTKKDDFESKEDLQIAYFIIDQQIKCVHGNAKNILVPDEYMKNPQPKAITSPQITTVSAEAQSDLINSQVQSIKTNDLSLEQLCLLCATRERQVACLPCGHFCSCIVCGFGSSICPICRTPIRSFARIYL